jgi:hypothetical protein
MTQNPNTPHATNKKAPEFSLLPYEMKMFISYIRMTDRRYFIYAENEEAAAKAAGILWTKFARTNIPRLRYTIDKMPGFVKNLILYEGGYETASAVLDRFQPSTLNLHPSTHLTRESKNAIMPIQLKAERPRCKKHRERS